MSAPFGYEGMEMIDLEPLDPDFVFAQFEFWLEDARRAGYPGLASKVGELLFEYNPNQLPLF